MPFEFFYPYPEFSPQEHLSFKRIKLISIWNSTPGNEHQKILALLDYYTRGNSRFKRACTLAWGRNNIKDVAPLLTAFKSGRLNNSELLERLNRILLVNNDGNSLLRNLREVISERLPVNVADYRLNVSQEP